MDNRKCTSIDAPPVSMAAVNFLNKVCGKVQLEDHEDPANDSTVADVDIDLREVYFLIMHFLSSGPCQEAFGKLWDELLEYKLLPTRYHAWYSRSRTLGGDGNNDGNSLPLNYNDLVGRYSHIEKDHLVKLLKQLMLTSSPPPRDRIGRTVPSAADVPTLLGTGSFSLLSSQSKVNKLPRNLPSYLRWPHMHADQVRGLRLREIGGGFSRHYRAPSIRNACYAIAKASTMVQKMQNVKKLRGHRNAVYCAIFDHRGRYVITGSDDRLVKIWSMETAFCLASCRGHEGDITDLSVSSNNAVVASASNDYSIRVWRLPDGYPISVLRGHTGAVTAIAFSPRPSFVYNLLSSSDDGTCRIWDARYSQMSPRVYLPKPTDATAGMSSGLPSASASSNGLQSHQILCCAYNANGTVFVTGSSDTFARVWNAVKSNSDDPEQPSHEIDILAGHENDVNYVQFSGCAVASRSLPSDPPTEESIPKFKNSWFSHDNIVTCSRDGSAIIWIPRSRRSHVKAGRWTRAYHLKVPPPPMPPQPPRGGPRQRLLPTPRGVNMIVWSLDNRFVLAAIMDNRICVWNASDGSLVHSLTGHTASTYVLDVHPFNPRIAMSAGYDGKTILWDIWEGTPIRVYEISGRFKLVDGKFSQDGTSIVLSDDVGQIYFLNTGQGESQKDAKYDQFFLGDYRPLIQDTHGNIIDQETQLTTYRRNIQDPLCDSSMLPYPEPYQSMYQRRRLGALGIEWHPSSIKFAVGTDIGIGQEFHILPLPDLDLPIEPPSEFIDAMYWEPEIDVMNDDNDSEYNVTEGSSSDEQNCQSDSLSSDPECSEDMVRCRWRSKQKKPVVEVDSVMTSGRGIKKRIPDEQDGTKSGSKRYKKSKNGGRAKSRRKSPKSKSLRPQRLAARNAVSNFSQITETSTDGDEEDGSAGDSSDSESSFEGSAMQRQVPIGNLQNRLMTEDVVKPLKQPQSGVNVENKKKLVLKFSLRDPKSPVYPENTRKPLNSQEEQSQIDLRLGDLGSSSINIVDKEPSEEFNTSQLRETEKLASEDNSLKASSCGDGGVSWGKFKLRTSKGMQLGDHVSADENGARVNQNLSAQETKSLSNALPPHDHQDTGSGVSIGQNQSGIVNDSSNPKQKPTIIKIKSKHILGDSKDSSQPRIVSKDSSQPTEQSCLYGNRFSESFDVSLRNQEVDTDLPDVATDEVRRSRSTNLVYRNFEMSEDRLQPGTSRGAENPSMEDPEYFAPLEWRSMSKCTVKMRSSRNKREYYHREDRSVLAGAHSHTPSRKQNWLLLTQQEEGCRYIPQLGDKVVYLRQGHEEYLEKSRSARSGPWMKHGDKIKAVEICSIEDLKYTTCGGSGESSCRITLKSVDTSSKVVGKTFQLTLPELTHFPDFILEWNRYDAAMKRNWTVGSKCVVWWRNETGEGGAWWEGRIVSVKDKSSDFPGSPWERCEVLYTESEEAHIHSPWELHDPENQGEPPHSNLESTEKILYSFTRLLRSASKDKDRHGISQLNEIAQKLEFINRFPVPLSPDIIMLRLENNYYRSFKALKHDTEVMLSNARSYFEINRELLKKMKRLSSWFKEAFSEL